MGGGLGALAWLWLGLGCGQAATISPTDPSTLMLDVGAAVSVSLYQLDSALPVVITPSSPSRCARTGTSFYRDVTDCYLPEVGKSVFVVVNGSDATPTLVLPGAVPAFPLGPGASNPFVAALTTSAYPGQFINVGSGTDADALLAAVATSLSISATTSVMGWKLTPQDGGMMAVIEVGPHRFIIPGDGTATVAADGLPEIWVNLHGGNLDPAGDGDTGPAANSPTGDGLVTFDEYRGALTSGKHVRLDPLQKDVFVYVVTGQCPTAATPLSLLLGDNSYPTPTSPNAELTLPAAPEDSAIFTASAAVFSAANVRGEIIGSGGRARITAVVNSTTVVAEITRPFAGTRIAAGSWQLTESLLANVYGLFSAERVRLLGAGPTPTNSSEWVDNLASYGELTGIVLTAAGSTTDRVVNVNRLYGTPQKGVRAIECLDDSVTSPYGFAIGGIGSPNVIGNVILYTKRMVNNLNAVIAAKAPRKVRYSPMLEPVLSAGRVKDWLPKTLVGDGNPSNPAIRNFIISKAMQFYTGMEVGHSLRLSATAPTHPHFSPFSGDALDAAITSKPDRLSTGFNTFYIPSLYSIVDQSQLLIK